MSKDNIVAFPGCGRIAQDDAHAAVKLEEALRCLDDLRAAVAEGRITDFIILGYTPDGEPQGWASGAFDRREWYGACEEMKIFWDVFTGGFD